MVYRRGVGPIRWLRRSAEGRTELVDAPVRPTPEPVTVLLRVASEALILQDEAEAVLAAVGRHEHLGTVAPRAGPLVRRFFALRDTLPRACLDPQLNRLSQVLDTICYHHAMQVATALEFLAVEWRSERLRSQVSAIAGLGAPAALLEDVYRELSAAR